jgi:thiamine-monophosphate kinase
MSSEDALIERVRRKFPSDADGAPVGIGDDAGVVRPKRGTDWVITTDAFLENVHFLKKIHPPKSVGYKALARAASDLAAMGARSRFFLLTLALPDASTNRWLDDFLDGMAKASRRFGLALIGGDTTKYPLVLINLTVIGEADRGRSVLRSGARPGDAICVSGRLGEAELGLQLIQRRLHGKNRWKGLLKKHLYPEPRLELGQWLAEGKRATAMIDTSDGLSTDLEHICNASGVGAKVFAEKIPLVKVPPDLQRQGFDPLRLGIDGGEDYELLFSMPKNLAIRLPLEVAGVPITIIGEITREKGVRLIDSIGRSRPLKPGGWDPFRRKT